jgi:hypothetical protein
MGWTIEVQLPAKICLPQDIQTNSETHPASYLMNTEVPSLGIKLARMYRQPLIPPCTTAKHEWNLTTMFGTKKVKLSLSTP